MAWRGQSLPLPVSHWRKGSVGPQLESATVERRKGSRSHREGPRLTSAGVAPRTRDRRKKSAPVGAPSTPHRGTELLVSRRPLAPKPHGLAGRRESKTPAKRRTTRAQQTCRGSEQHCAV